MWRAWAAPSLSPASSSTGIAFDARFVPVTKLDRFAVLAAQMSQREEEVRLLLFVLAIRPGPDIRKL